MHPLSTSVKDVIAGCGTQDSDRRLTFAGELHTILNVNALYSVKIVN